MSGLAARLVSVGEGYGPAAEAACAVGAGYVVLGVVLVVGAVTVVVGFLSGGSSSSSSAIRSKGAETRLDVIYIQWR